MKLIHFVTFKSSVFENKQILCELHLEYIIPSFSINYYVTVLHVRLLKEYLNSNTNGTRVQKELYQNFKIDDKKTYYIYFFTLLGAP